MDRFITAHKGIYGSIRDGWVRARNVIICDQISFSLPIAPINVDSLITQKSIPLAAVISTPEVLHVTSASNKRLSTGSPAGTKQMYS